MTKLPAWIEAIAKETGTSSAAFNPRLVQALGIAWEALDAYAKPFRFQVNKHSQEEPPLNVALNIDEGKAAKDALRQIEELGK